jgi:hypothetical protein
MTYRVEALTRLHGIRRHLMKPVLMNFNLRVLHDGLEQLLVFIGRSRELPRL